MKDGFFFWEVNGKEFCCGLERGKLNKVAIEGLWEQNPYSFPQGPNPYSGFLICHYITNIGFKMGLERQVHKSFSIIEQQRTDFTIRVILRSIANRNAILSENFTLTPF